MKILVTGAAGFVGSHILEQLIEQGADVIAVDSLTYAGRLDRIEHLRHRNIKFVYHDFRQNFNDLVRSIHAVDYIIHNGAETHVARSFNTPGLFVESNALGTLQVLEAARHWHPQKFIYVSTDEVLGPASDVPLTEESPLHPTNPYAASKASAELLAYSYFRAFKVPVVISRTMNIFGERQHPEKFVPMTIKKILNGETVQLHGVQNKQGLWISGSRNWLYAKDQARALAFLLEHGIAGETYHIRGQNISNFEMFSLINQFLGENGQFDMVKSPLPVHDFSYSLDGQKMRSMGWKNKSSIEGDLKQTVEWTVEHPQFLEE